MLRSEALVQDLHIKIESHDDEIEGGIKDVYDDNALHFLHYFKPIDLIVGGIRFVKPTLHVGNYMSFPSARLFPNVQQFIDHVDPVACLEISRFMVSKINSQLMRAHLEDINYAYEEDLYPPKILYLLEMIYKVALENNAQYLIGSFDAYLIRILKKMGFIIKVLDKPNKKFNELQPFYIPIEEAIHFLEKSNPRVFYFFTDHCAVH